MHQEISMAKGESSTNQKADWIENVEAKVQWLYDYWQTHFPGTKEDKMLDMEYAISTCVVDIYAIIPEGKFLLWIIQKKKMHSIQFLNYS